MNSSENSTATSAENSTTMPKVYEPQAVEPKIYATWEKSGAFSPINDKIGAEKAVPYCLINPPTNANGVLHLGHAVGTTLQDLMIRYHRMKGEAALWLPGFDHAGFETQIVYEKKLEKEGRSRFSIPREQLYQEIYDFTQASKSGITEQFKKLGASMDWSREMFTLDPKIISYVYETFKQMHEDGLVYRDKRPVNWCTRHQTSLSDLEVKHEERVDPLYYLKYGPLSLATVRPETKFGDTALAVNPNDPRYQKWIGQEITYESLLGPAKLTVIADAYVNPEFGTGVVKITPAHDPNDFAVAKRHNLPAIEVIDQFGKLNDKTGPYAGLKIKEARAKIVDDLQAKGLILKIDEQYTHSVSVCYKCGHIIEPRVLPQWFIAMTKTGKSGKNLRDDAVAAVKKGETRFVTEKHENLFYAWMKELRDWNISRQIVWGIRLPVWYCEKITCEPIVTNGSTPKVCPNCGGKNLRQDPDVFDTWFSSGQWPMASLTANSPKDFARFYPTAILETGYDIIFFWVARMIMLGLYCTGKTPFQAVYLHGLVRDKDRQKMSKSKGNVIDPLGVAQQYGSDAMRMALIFGNAAGNDIIISEEKIRGMRNFVNKLWNISRFIILKLEGRSYTLAQLNSARAKTPADHKMQEGLNELTAKVTRHLEENQFHLAGELLYEYVWHQFADIYLEVAKAQLVDEAAADEAAAERTYRLLLRALLTQIALAHPFMPFITEAIYQALPIADKTPWLMTNAWPLQPD